MNLIKSSYSKLIIITCEWSRLLIYWHHLWMYVEQLHMCLYIDALENDHVLLSWLDYIKSPCNWVLSPHYFFQMYLCSTLWDMITSCFDHDIVSDMHEFHLTFDMIWSRVIMWLMLTFNGDGHTSYFTILRHAPWRMILIVSLGLLLSMVMQPIIMHDSLKLTFNSSMCNCFQAL